MSVLKISAREKPKGIRAWIGRKLIAMGRRLAPHDDAVMADVLEEMMYESVAHGRSVIEVKHNEEMWDLRESQ